MKIRLFSAIVLVFVSFSFSGCFEIYYDIVQNANGTFNIRQTVGMRQDVFAQLADFVSGFGADSTNSGTHPTRENLIDSMRRSFAHHRDSLLATGTVIGQNGITAFTAFDTTHDSIVFFTLQSTVSSIDSLPDAFHWMQSVGMKSGAATALTDSDEVLLTIRKARSNSIFHFYSQQGNAGIISTDLPGAEQIFKDLHLHFRVFSTMLQKSHDKHIQAIPGVEERVFGIKELSSTGKHTRIEAIFTVRSGG